MSAAEQIEDPAVCILRLGRGERVSAELASLLNPVDPATFHVYHLPPKSDVALHYHDEDEYWSFIEGRPTVTLRTPAGVMKRFELEPGDMVANLRGMEHTLWADHELVYFQYSSVLTGDERPGHLLRP